MKDIKIPYQRYHFKIQAIEPLSLPYYKGSTFRGGFGNVFKRIVCALKKQDCKTCLLYTKCIYAYVFETSPCVLASNESQIMNMHKYEKIPHPFIIEPPLDKSKTCDPGKVLNFSLILIGKAIDYLPYFIYTFDELGKSGIGKGRGKFKMLDIKSDNQTTVYSAESKTITNTDYTYINIPFAFEPASMSDDLTIRFITPLRIKYNRDLVVKPEFHILIRNLMRRLGLLYYFHCGNESPAWDHKAIISHSEIIEIKSSSLFWHDWERYSHRQDARMKLGGLIGETTYHGNISPFIPFLQAGEILHIGKNTSFGLGKYEII